MPHQPACSPDIDTAASEALTQLAALAQELDIALALAAEPARARGLRQLGSELTITTDRLDDATATLNPPAALIAEAAVACMADLAILEARFAHHCDHHIRGHLNDVRTAAGVLARLCSW